MELMYCHLQKIQGKIETRSGLNIIVQCSGDLFALNEMYIKKVYDQEPVRIPYNSVVLDVGAHIGTFSLYAAKLCKAKKVYSFEPCPESYETLKLNIQNNQLNDIITPIQTAIDAKAETRELLIDPENSLRNSFYVSDQNSQRSDAVKVKCITLKQTMKENNVDFVDFLKLDCEGSEWGILETIDQETISKIGIIAMEYHFKSREEFSKLLGQIGYSVFDSDEKWRNASYIIATKNQENHISGSKQPDILTQVK